MRANTENIEVKEIDGWKKVDFEICSNRGVYDLEFVRAERGTTPANGIRGHILKKEESLSMGALLDVNGVIKIDVYFKSQYKNGLLAVD